MASLTSTEIILIVITVVLGVIVVCGLIYLFFFHRTKNVKNIESVVNGASVTQYFEKLPDFQKKSFLENLKREEETNTSDKNPETGFGGFLELSNKQNDFENFVKNRGNANLEQPNNESNNNDFENFASRKYGTKFV